MCLDHYFDSSVEHHHDHESHAGCYNHHINNSPLSRDDSDHRASHACNNHNEHGANHQHH